MTPFDSPSPRHSRRRQLVDGAWAMGNEQNIHTDSVSVTVDFSVWTALSERQLTQQQHRLYYYTRMCMCFPPATYTTLARRVVNYAAHKLRDTVISQIETRTSYNKFYTCHTDQFRWLARAHRQHNTSNTKQSQQQPRQDNNCEKWKEKK